MKIKFIAYKPIFEKNKDPHYDILETGIDSYSTRIVHSYIVVGDKKVAKRYEKDGYSELTTKALNMAKALEYNQCFQEFINSVRREKQYHAFSIGFFQKYVATNWQNNPPEEIYNSFLKLPIFKEVQKRYNVDNDVLKQIPTIISYGCIFLPLLQDIKIAPNYLIAKPEGQADIIKPISKDDTGYESININISSTVAIERVYDYLKLHKTEFNNINAKLSGNKKLTFHKKAFKILALKRKNPKLTFPKMERTIGLDDPSLRKISSETNKKIKALFSPKKS